MKLSLRDRRVIAQRLAVIRGRHIHNALERANKGWNAAEARLETNIGQLYVGFHQLAAVIDAALENIFRHRYAKIFSEQAGYVLAAVKKVGGYVGDGGNFIEMLVNIMLYFHQGSGQVCICRTVCLSRLVEKIKNLQHIRQHKRVVFGAVAVGVLVQIGNQVHQLFAVAGGRRKIAVLAAELLQKAQQRFAIIGRKSIGIKIKTCRVYCVSSVAIMDM